MPYRKIINKGDVYGRLTVIKEIDPLIRSNGRKRRILRCRCTCNTIVDVRLEKLSNGHTTSCGCYHKEVVTKHGMSNSSLYYVYHNMLQRCNNSNNEAFEYYGGRGIKVCKKWRGFNGFENFNNWNLSLPKEKQWHKGLELDRENNSKGYYPGNCRWVVRLVNLNNRANSLVIKEGPFEGMTLKELIKEFGSVVPYDTARSRYNKGWSAIDSISMKPHSRK